jgi:hypothetical protein
VPITGIHYLKETIMPYRDPAVPFFVSTILAALIGALVFSPFIIPPLLVWLGVVPPATELITTAPLPDRNVLMSVVRDDPGDTCDMIMSDESLRELVVDYEIEPDGSMYLYIDKSALPQGGVEINGDYEMELACDRQDDSLTVTVVEVVR